MTWSRKDIPLFQLKMGYYVFDRKGQQPPLFGSTPVLFRVQLLPMSSNFLASLMCSCCCVRRG